MPTSRGPAPNTLRTFAVCLATAATLMTAAPGAGAQPPAAPPQGVSGRVVDAATARPVAAVSIRAGERRTSSDAAGRFALDVPAGTWTLVIAAPGYLDEQVDVVVPALGRASVEVLLVARKLLTEEVSVTAPAAAAAPAPATLPVRPIEVMSIAGGGENIFRTLQTMPGVAGTDDFSSRLSVRGGGPDQNLTVMDGVEVHDPYRLWGLTSAFNPETVDSFELTAGAFSAKYGDRLSSLLVVQNRAGTDSRALAGSGALSITDANLVLEGALPRHLGSWLVTGRRTYYDLVAERFTDSDLPSFNDLQGRAVVRLGTGRTLTVSGLRSREATDASFDVPEESANGSVFTRARNDLAAATVDAAFGTRAWSRTVASAYDTRDIVDFGASFRNDTRRSNAPDDDLAFDQASLHVAWTGTVRDLAVRQDIGLALGARHVVETGAEVHRLTSTVGFSIDGIRNPAAANGSSLQGGAGLPSTLRSTRSDTRVGTWIQDRWQVHPRVAAEAGVRLDRSTINARTYVSPRLSATWAVRPALRVRAAFGVHRQSPGYEKLSQADYFIDLTSGGPLPLDSERARHVLAALEQDLRGGVTLRLEGYYKGFDRLIIGRLETDDERRRRLATYDFPAGLAWSLPADPMVTTLPTNDGRGRAWGFDVYAAKRGASPDSRVNGWASYTFGRAERTNYGRAYPFDYDRRHAFSAVTDIRLTRTLRFSFVARLASGFPYTPARGVRVAAAPDTFDTDRDGNTAELVPQRDASGLLVYEPDRGGLANLGSARLPAYGRLDARLTYTPRWGGGRLWFYLDVINATRRKNAGTMQTTLAYDPGADRPRLVHTPEGSLPLIPSLGIHVDLSRPRR